MPLKDTWTTAKNNSMSSWSQTHHGDYPIAFNLGFGAALDMFESANGNAKHVAAAKAQKTLYAYRDRINTSADLDVFGKSSLLSVLIAIDWEIAPYAAGH